MQENSMQAVPFDYTALDETTRTFVQHKADETHGLLKRTAETIILIGHNLKAVKEQLPHGQFLPWLQMEFGMSRVTANNFMHVAETFDDKCKTVLHLPARVLYELAAPSTEDAIVQQVAAGEIPATLDAIKEAKAALKHAQHAEQQARRDAQHIQQQLVELQQNNTQLTQEIFSLEQQLAEPSTPVVQIKEVEVIPQQMMLQLEKLQNQLTATNQQRDALVEQVTQLGAEARAQVLSRNQQERGSRIRQQWQQATKEWCHSGSKLLAGWPTTLDLEVFDQEEWAYLYQVQEIARLIIESCQNLSKLTDRVVSVDT